MIGLQAVDKFWSARSGNLDEPAELARRLDMHVGFAPNLDSAPASEGQPRRQYGVAILSKLPILESRNTLLPKPGNTPDRRIDFIALSPGVDVRSAQVVDTLASDLRPYTGKLAITTSTSAAATVGGDVPATLALDLGPAAAFPTFVPGVDRTYDVSTTATVTSTADDALRTGTYAQTLTFTLSTTTP